ncbi:hypothetical protein [Mobilicoccus massiliensis]|uniref:hypothetical protein n=1 Tax=Mobilicoccus massiliensis TaxID=1522310 RepID=UPI00114312A8|nr:hypothetical protein [Mobilicoccus massiliensis]
MSIVGDPIFIAAEHRYRREQFSVAPRVDRAARIGGNQVLRRLRDLAVGLVGVATVTATGATAATQPGRLPGT